MTEDGLASLSRALVEAAIGAPEHKGAGQSWKKLLAGLRFDGFELVETESEIESDALWQSERTEKSLKLVRMLPSHVPELDFREAEDEISLLMDQHGFIVAKGHLQQAISAFSRENGRPQTASFAISSRATSMRSQIALATQVTLTAKPSVISLGLAWSPPFLIADYNEWHAKNQKPQYIQGLMSRMHPHGGHPGLSEEEDATFRLQITLITARLLLRRFDQKFV